MKKLMIFILMVAMLASLSLAMPITLEKTKFDGLTLASENSNRLNVERGEEYIVEVSFTAIEDLEDVEVEAFISGYEYNDDNRISDLAGPFDADNGVTYVKKLKIEIPEDADEDSYKLRIIVSDKYNLPFVANYNLKIALPRHDMVIEDVIINPSNVVEAGSAIIVTVRVDNKGEKDEDDVRVEVSIPQLGISNVEYIDEVESDDEENTEEIFLRIPRCSQAGVYEIDVVVAYSNKHETVTAKGSIQVLEDKSCKEESTTESKAVITVGTQVQSGNSGSTLVYPITFSNKGSNTRLFTITAEDIDWAEISVTPSNSILVKGKDTQILYLNVKVNEDTEAGSYTINTNLGSDGDSKQIAFTSNIIEPKTSSKGWLEFAVIALIVLVIIISLVVVFRSKEEKEYY